MEDANEAFVGVSEQHVPETALLGGIRLYQL